MTRKKLVIPFLFFCLIATSFVFSGCFRYASRNSVGQFARSFEFEPPNLDSLKKIKFNVQPYTEKYKGNNAVYLTFNMVVDQTTYYSSAFTGTVKYIVLNKNYTPLTTVKFNWGVNSFYAIVRNPDGWVKAFGIDDLVKTTEDGNTVYKLAFPNVQNGTLIEYGYELTSGLALFYNPFIMLPTQFYHPCENLNLTVAVPTGSGPFVKPLPNNNLGGKLKTEVDEENAKTIFYYTRKNIPAVKEEKMSLELNQIVPPFIVSHNQGLYGGAITYNDYMKDYWKATPYKVEIEEDFAEIVKGILKKCKTKQEKADTIISYVRREIKSGYWNTQKKSIDYEAILEEKEAQSYIRVGLIQAMMHVADINAKYILAYPTTNGDMDGLNQNISGMDPGLLFTIDKKDYVVFPFENSVPYHTIPYYYVGQKAFLLEPRSKTDQENFTYTTIDLPTSSPVEPEIDETLDITISDNGLVSVKDTRVLTGSAAVSTRETINDSKKEEQPNIFKKNVNYKDVKLNITKLDYQNLKKKSSGPLTINAEYTIDNMVTLLPDEAVLQTNGLFGMYDFFSIEDDSSKRENKVKIVRNEKSTRKLIIHLPDKWQVTDVKPSAVTKNSVGEIEWKFTQNDPRTITIEITRKVKYGLYEPEMYSELLDIIGQHGKYVNDNLIFTIKQ